VTGDDGGNAEGTLAPTVTAKGMTNGLMRLTIRGVIADAVAFIDICIGAGGDWASMPRDGHFRLGRRGTSREA